MAFPAGTQFTQGSSGGVFAITAAWNDATTDMPPAIGAPVPVAVAELDSWRLSDSVQSEGVITFNSAVNSNGVLYPTRLRGGTSPGAKFEVSGKFNADPALTSGAKFKLGSIVVCNFYHHKGNTAGYHLVQCEATSFSTGATAAGKANDFSCTLEVIGVVPDWSLT